MGLPSGPHGVKTFMKESFPNSMREFNSLKECREKTGHSSSQAVVVMDGNVLCRAIPLVVDTFDGYMRIFNGFLKQGFSTADLVIVVFDEPQILTKAKLEEQKKRDAAQKRSAPIFSADLQEKIAPVTDDYGQDELETSNPHEVMKHRKARMRFFDSVCRSSMMSFEREKSGSQVLTFDGIDCRGAERPSSAEREPSMYSSDSKVEQLLTRASNSPLCGEGDLKLTDICSEIQTLKNSDEFFKNIEIAFVSTIDTDSIAIELMHRSKNELCFASNMNDPPLKTILCFRETSKKRSSDDSERKGATFSCFDIEELHKSIVTGLFKDCKHTPTPDEYYNAICLLCAGWSLCGSDFVRLKGMRSDIVMSAVKQLCHASNAHILKRMSHVAALSRTSTPEEVAVARTDVTTCIQTLVSNSITILADTPRLQKSCASAKLYESEHLLRSAWVTFYWSGLEFSDIEAWGFSGTHEDERPTLDVT